MMINEKERAPTLRAYGFKLNPQDAATFDQFCQTNRMSISSAIRSGLVKAGILKEVNLRQEVGNAQQNI